MGLSGNTAVAQEVFTSENLLQYLQRDRETLSYRVTVLEKSFFQDDTLKLNYDVFAEKNLQDTIYGYNFKIVNPHITIYNLNGTLYRFFSYNGERKFLMEQKKDDKLNLLLIPNMNLDGSDLNDRLHTSVAKVEEVYLVHKHYDSLNEIKNIDLFYNFSTVGQQLLSFTSSLYFQNDQQYRHQDFGVIKFDFDIDFIKEVEQLLDVSTPFEVSKEKTAAHLEQFPNIEGSLLSSDQTAELRMFDSKVLILDYWYMACYPCIKSIPVLNKIRDKYATSQVQVVGINIVDNKNDKYASLSKFVDKHKINYPLFFTEENPLSINSFPTLVFLDKDFKIIFTESGYAENMEKDIMEAIEKHLLK